MNRGLLDSSGRFSRFCEKSLMQFCLQAFSPKQPYPVFTGCSRCFLA